MHSAKLALILWLLILVSAISVVTVTFQSRSVFIAWQETLQTAEQLDVEWGQLILEKNTLASYTRLQGIAEKKLGMVEPKGQRIEIIKDGS
ncbi:MAG: cell division protein FtsL [Cellvibrionales bacterium]|nr:cell division protein FtsL [Cellvibrionales bacterium]